MSVNRNWYVGLLLILLAACSSESTEPAAESLDGYREKLALVDGKIISVEDFERTYVASLISTGANDTRANRDRHLQNLIDAELLYRAALAEGLDADSLSARFRERTFKKVLGGRFFETAFLETLEPLSDIETRRAFALSKEKAVVRHLFFRDSTAANEAWMRLEAGGDFLDEAARVYGLSQVDSAAGYLGPIKYYMVDDAFAEAAFALPVVGTYTRPVRSRVGYHIILLEDRIVNPIITESEYQTKKAGIASQARLRKRRLEGDQFVRDFMGGLGVAVNPAAIEALAADLELLERSAVADGVELSTLSELPSRPALETELAPDTPLARYTLNGEQRVFTAEEYAFWLPDLPFHEARHRTAASVGRALRNEVFAAEGMRLGLDDDPEVATEMEYQMRIHLSKRKRDQIHREAATNPDFSSLEALYEELGIEADTAGAHPRTFEVLSGLAAEREALDRLRGRVEIEVDSLLFTRIAELD